MTQPDRSSNGARIRNVLIAIAAIALSLSIFLGFNTTTASVSLETQAEESMSLEAALSNGNPTLVEFYANWCTTCQAMAPDLAALKQQYTDSVNFVMLNVDNSKWLPEILRFRVDGIPHFVFFNQQGEAIAETIGEQPRPVLEADLNALVAELPLPYTYSTGRVSEFNPASSTNQDDPRSHGSQVKG